MFQDAKKRLKVRYEFEFAAFFKNHRITTIDDKELYGWTSIVYHRNNLCYKLELDVYVNVLQPQATGVVVVTDERRTTKFRKVRKEKAKQH